MPRPTQLLKSLMPIASKHWLAFLEPVELPTGRVVLEAGMPSSHVLFPTTAIVSLLHRLNGGESTEIAVVGREGMLGIAAFWEASRRAAVPSSALPAEAGGGEP